MLRLVKSGLRAAAILAGAVVIGAAVPLDPPHHDGLDTTVVAARGRPAPASGGSQYSWPRGPRSDPAFFPLGVWLQAPANAAEYRAIGINTYVGLWEGPSEAQLEELDRAGMTVIADQNQVGLDHLDDPTITGWLQQDEPDNAQSDGAGGWGPCIEPAVIRARYQEMRAADPQRPVLLNLGQNVAWEYDRPYIGRGSECSERWDQYPEYVKGGDIVAFDIYPVTSEYPEIQGNLWVIARGLERLYEWTNGEKVVWNYIETAHIGSTQRPTPEQIESEVWMSLIHGSKGIVYFAHEWVPEFREAALLYYPEVRAAVAKLNREIIDLAPVLNADPAEVELDVESSPAEVPVDVLVKEHDGALYIFAIAMRDGAATANFRLDGLSDGSIEVMGEGRTIAASGGAFSDTFSGYEVHRYRVAWPQVEMTPAPETPAPVHASLWLPVSETGPAR